MKGIILITRKVNIFLNTQNVFLFIISSYWLGLGLGLGLCLGLGLGLGT